MVEIGLLTLNSKMYNYGGILQEYALLNVLQRYGNAHIIDYDLTSETYTFSIKRSLLNFSVNKIYYRLRQMSHDEQFSSQYSEQTKQQFDDFRANNLKLTRVFNRNDLVQNNGEFNYIFCGSDQIWNPDYNVPSFFLDFNSDAKKVIYGASIGKSHLTKRQKKIYGNYISKLSEVSVREKEIISLLQNYTNTEFTFVLDPTFLLTKKEWDSVIPKRELSEKYIFCYFLENNVQKKSLVEDYAQKKGLKIVYIPYLHFVQDEFIIENSYFPSNRNPFDFLSLIKNAEFIITDSFHATVFSIMFERQFVALERKTGEYNMNSRIVQVLDLFDLQNRLIVYPSIDNIENINKDCITFETERFNILREDSLKFIERQFNRKRCD